MYFEAVDNGGRKPKWPPPIFGQPAVMAAPADELEDHAPPAVALPQGPASAPHASPPNVQPLDPAAAGDPVLYYVRRGLKARRYSPGGLDGRWGSGTSGPLSGLMNDRGLAVPLPSSIEEFHGILGQVRAELARPRSRSSAMAVGWFRPVSTARANADPHILAQLAPEITPARRISSPRCGARSSPRLARSGKPSAATSPRPGISSQGIATSSMTILA